jgi:AcrR family transcriptional regulator
MNDANERTEHRDRILGCACDLYLKDGFEGFSMRKLAREVGVTAPAIYRHYEGKEALLLDVVKEAFKVMAQHLYTALGGGTPEERFAMAGEAYLEFALQHPRYYEITYTYSQYLGLDEPPEEIAPLACGIGQFWNDRVRECMDAGFLQDDDPDAVSLSFWAHSHGLLSLYQRGLLPVTEEEFREIFRAQTGRLMTGVGGEAERERIRSQIEGTPVPPLVPDPKPDRPGPRTGDEPEPETELQGKAR